MKWIKMLEEIKDSKTLLSERKDLVGIDENSQILKAFLATKQEEAEENTIIPTVSTKERDAYGDIVEPQGGDFTRWRKNPVVMWAHDYKVPPIGRGLWIKADKESIISKMEFAPSEFAQQLYSLATPSKNNGGKAWIQGWSIGFIPTEADWIKDKGEDEEENVTGIRFLKWNLLEYSLCPIPANPEALSNAIAKGVLPVENKDILRQLKNSVMVDMGSNDKAEKADEETKPYPNEHSCRLIEPDKFDSDSFRRTKRESDGKEYSVIMGKLKGEDDMTEQAYRYEKDVWKEEEAKEHCDEHEGIKFEPATEEEDAPKADMPEKWDAGEEFEKAEVEDLKVMCAWVDKEKEEEKEAYKLLHHKADGEHEAVWFGVTACGAVIMGARGGVDVPEEDMAGIKAHIKKHYEEFDEEVPWENEDIVELVEELQKDIEEGNEVAEEELEMVLECVAKGACEISLTSAGKKDKKEEVDDKVDEKEVKDDKVEDKAGAVLNKSNKAKLKEASDMILGVLASAGAEEEEDKEGEGKTISAEEIERMRLLLALFGKDTAPENTESKDVLDGIEYKRDPKKKAEASAEEVESFRSEVKDLLAKTNETIRGVVQQEVRKSLGKIDG